MRYLKGTLEHGLYIPKFVYIDIVAYSYAYWTLLPTQMHIGHVILMIENSLQLIVYFLVIHWCMVLENAAHSGKIKHIFEI